MQGSDAQTSVIDSKGATSIISASMHILKHENKTHFEALDLLVLPLKFYHLAPLIAQLQGQLPSDLPILLLQNGLGGHELLEQAFPANPLFLGATTDAIVKLSPHQIRIHARGELVIGSLAQSSATKAVDTLLTLHPKGMWHSNILYYLYKKLAVNAVINPISAIYKCRNGEIKRYPALVAGIKQEVFALYEALSLDIDLDELNAYIEEVIQLTANNYSSMYQDFVNQRPTEIDSILGVLLNKAAAQKMSLPCILSCYNKIKQSY